MNYEHAKSINCEYFDNYIESSGKRNYSNYPLLLERSLSNLMESIIDSKNVKALQFVKESIFLSLKCGFDIQFNANINN
jgi:hypothetical protein